MKAFPYPLDSNKSQQDGGHHESRQVNRTNPGPVYYCVDAPVPKQKQPVKCKVYRKKLSGPVSVNKNQQQNQKSQYMEQNPQRRG